MKAIPSTYRFCLILLLFSSCGPSSSPAESQKKREKITIAVAANVQFAMQELEAAFEQEHDVAIETVISSSGKLAAQVMQGAPYSIFLSANLDYPQAVQEAGYGSEALKTYAYGALVLWSRKNIQLDTNLQLLQHPSIDKIAIANPRNAPYGAEAINALKYYGIYEQVEGKLAYGESIAQTNQYILSKAVDLGITAKSAVLAPAIQGKGEWLELSSKAYQPIEQGAMITKYGMKHAPEACKKFWDFLFSPKARSILLKYGYSTE